MSLGYPHLGINSCTNHLITVCPSSLLVGIAFRVLNGPENYNPTRPGPWLSKPEPDVTRDINMNYLPEPGPRPEAEFSHVILWRLAVGRYCTYARSGARSAHADFRYDR